MGEGGGNLRILGNFKVNKKKFIIDQMHAIVSWSYETMCILTHGSSISYEHKVRGFCSEGQW